MYDDFWSGFNYGTTTPKPFSAQAARQVKQEIYERGKEKIRQQASPAMYNKTKFTKMVGPQGEKGEIYADGKMYIIFPTGKPQVRRFPSRPVGIRYMQEKFGWVVIE